MERDDPAADAGARIRALRTARGMTLSQLAAQAGLTPSTLSRLETGKRKPTLEQLLPLAQVMQVPLEQLVGAPATGDPRVHLRPVRKEGLTYIPLSRRPDGIRAFKIIYPGTAPDAPPRVPTRRRSHEGYEWLFVLNGSVRLILGDRDVVLSAGEVAEFDTHVPHWIGSSATEPAEVLALMGPQGERARASVLAQPDPL